MPNAACGPCTKDWAVTTAVNSRKVIATSAQGRGEGSVSVLIRVKPDWWVSEKTVGQKSETAWTTFSKKLHPEESKAMDGRRQENEDLKELLFFETRQ